MSARLIGAQAPYGAFELKRCYQKNMLTGTLISGGLPLMILAVFVLIAYIGSLGTIEVIIPVENTRVITTIPPPTPISPKRPESDVSVKVDLPTIGKPNPVEDEEIFNVNVVASIIEKEKIVMDGIVADGSGGEGGEYFPGELVDQIIPPTGTFVPREEEPVLISAPKPVYPDMARRAGIEGVVIMQVYIDKNGDVIKAEVVKDSGCNAGFEEAALAAAMQRKYRPALQNDQPVAVWLGYTVRFQLH